MALANPEGSEFRTELHFSQLVVGQDVLVVEEYYEPTGKPHSHPIGRNEITGTVAAVPPADSEAGYMHLQLGNHEDGSPGHIQVLGIARGVAMYNRRQVESQAHFYLLELFA